MSATSTKAISDCTSRWPMYSSVCATDIRIGFSQEATFVTGLK